MEKDNSKIKENVLKHTNIQKKKWLYVYKHKVAHKSFLPGEKDKKIVYSSENLLFL